LKTEKAETARHEIIIEMDISTFPNKLNQLGRVLYYLQMHLNITECILEILAMMKKLVILL